MKHPDVVHITIQTVNSAFDDESWRDEVARILRRVAADLVAHHIDGALTQLHDSNGNRIGNVSIGNTPGFTH